MNGIPTVNLAAVIHLYFVAVFIGIFATESVIELHSYFNKDDPESLRMVTRYHYWIDSIVEIPVYLAIVCTGVWLAFLVDLTVWHWVLMGLAAAMLPGGLYCVGTVRKRRRMLLEGQAPDEDLQAQSKRIVWGVIFFINPFLTGVFCLGLWLAYNRVLDSIYG